MTGQFVIEKLGQSHERQSFRCGVPALDRYFHELAGQHARRRIANCFVMIDEPTGEVAGYYTLSAAAIPVSELPETLAHRLPHHQMVPAALIGRLAVATRFRGRRLGESLLLDAAERALASEPAVFAPVVDAKDDSAASFDRRYEFLPLAARPLSLFLPLAAIEARRHKDTRP